MSGQRVSYFTVSITGVDIFRGLTASGGNNLFIRQNALSIEVLTLLLYITVALAHLMAPPLRGSRPCSSCSSFTVGSM